MEQNISSGQNSSNMNYSVFEKAYFEFETAADCK